jgi:hypothetical protein
LIEVRVDVARPPVADFHGKLHQPNGLGAQVEVARRIERVKAVPAPSGRPSVGRSQRSFRFFLGHGRYDLGRVEVRRVSVDRRSASAASLSVASPANLLHANPPYEGFPRHRREVSGTFPLDRPSGPSDAGRKTGGDNGFHMQAMSSR